MTLVVLVGAAGSGKTTIARAVAARSAGVAKVFHFDSVGVPSPEEMARRYGSGDAWQRAKTNEWMLRLAQEADTGVPILFEGQIRFSFLADGATAAGGLEYVPILVDCDDDTRCRRLRIERKQPELASEEMLNWARYLRRQALERGHQILNTAELSLADSIERVMSSLGR